MNLLSGAAPQLHVPPALERTGFAPEAGTPPSPDTTADVLPAARQAHDRSATWIFAAAFVALVLKLAIAFNTIGTNDVFNFYRFGRLLSEQGLEWMYTNDRAFNHPPLVAYYLRGIYEFGNSPAVQANGISFPLLLRLPGIVADLVVLILLVRWRQRLALPTWSLLLLALSPVSLMVSGFHGNTDPVMVALLVAATGMCLHRRPVLCGILLALSCQVKIIPLLLLPIFMCFWFAKGRVLRFGWAFTAAFALLWIQPLLSFPQAVATNVLGYGSFWGCWGITYWLRMTDLPAFSVITYIDPPRAEQVVMTALKAAVVGCVLFLAWRQRRVSGRGLFQTIGIAWIIFFVLSPAIAPQYMVWLVPFVLVLAPSLAAYLMLSSSVFLFFFYNVTAGGLPWYMGVATRATNDVTAHWALWPWAVLTFALFAWCRNSLAGNTDSMLPMLRRTSMARAR